MVFMTPLHGLVSDSKNANPTVKIIVCGGGMAGLTFARALSFLRDTRVRAGESFPQISITILERDPSSVEREAQGYSLSLRADKIGGGSQVLEQIGLLGEIKKAAAPGDRFIMANKNFVPYFEIPPGSTVPSKVPNNPPLPVNIRISRKYLRNILLHSLPVDQCIVQWGAHAVEANTFHNGEGKEQVRITLASGELLEGDLLIVADGANSSIRRYLFPEKKLEYAGCVAFTGATHYPDGGLPSLVAEGVTFALDGKGQNVLLAPVDDTKIVFCVSYTTDKPIEEYRGDRKQLTQEQLDHFRAETSKYSKEFGYQSELNSFIVNADPKTIRVINAQDMKPHANTANPRIILIGDAAHAVSPFAGNGANMAIVDGFELAEQLLNEKHGGDLKAAVKAYDGRSIPRCKRTRGVSHFNISLLHSKGFKLTCFMALFKLMGWILIRPRTSIAVGCTILLVIAGLITGLVLWKNSS